MEGYHGRFHKSGNNSYSTFPLAQRLGRSLPSFLRRTQPLFEARRRCPYIPASKRPGRMNAFHLSSFSYPLLWTFELTPYGSIPQRGIPYFHHNSQLVPTYLASASLPFPYSRAICSAFELKIFSSPRVIILHVNSPKKQEKVGNSRSIPIYVLDVLSLRGSTYHKT
jgi:hypothetical protein